MPCLKINTEKMEVMKIGGIANTNIILDTETNLKWTDEPIKAFGVLYSKHNRFVDIEL